MWKSGMRGTEGEQDSKTSEVMTCGFSSRGRKPVTMFSWSTEHLIRVHFNFVLMSFTLLDTLCSHAEGIGNTH